MFYRLLLALLIVLPASLISQVKEEKKPNSYVGVEVCGTCHKSEKQGNQVAVWKASRHAQAYQTLLTPRADSIALIKGFQTPAIKTEQCLACHVSGYGNDAGLISAKFKIEDGVQCETCHGPGSNYKAMNIMKDKDKSIDNGLMMYSDVEAYCVRCHNENSPTYVKGDILAMWNEIKHPGPKK